MHIRHAFVLGASLALGACAGPGSQHTSGHPNDEAGARRAHDAYVQAINSNDMDRIAAMLTDDVVFLPPHEPRIVGKDAVRAWGMAYLEAFTIHWEKTSLEFVVSGDWAFEQYAYRSADTPRAGGDVMRDTGKGINVYHHDSDGVWRVARDAWSSDLPAQPGP